MAKKNEIMKPMSEALIEQLRQESPVEAGFTRIQLPRLGLVSQDTTEEVKNPKTGKKEIKVISEAGTFFTDVQSDEEVKGADGKKYKPWNKTEIGSGIEAIILFRRMQLRFYDATTEKYTSSPVYDSNDEIIPLFRDKKEVARGTPKELQARKEFQGVTAAGKPTSKLEENRILYVLYEGEIYQMNLRGTSMYAFMTYSKTCTVNMVLTAFGSEAKEKGTTKWNQMTFEAKRDLSQDEGLDVIGKINQIKSSIIAEKGYYANKFEQDEKKSGDEKVDAEVNNF